MKFKRSAIGGLLALLLLAAPAVGEDLGVMAPGFSLPAIANATGTIDLDALRGDVVYVDFWASWCGPCRTFAPVFEKVAEANPDIVFAKVDTEAEQGLAGYFQVSSIPTLMAIRDGVVLYSQAGALPQPALENLVQAVRDVDMDDVKKNLAEDSASDPS